MRRRIFFLIAAAALLSITISAVSASAAAGGGPAGLAAGSGDLLHRAAVVCGHWGCVRRGPAWRYRRWQWDRPWGYAQRPACPFGYYFACRRGPLGYGACACWPYRRY
jgi:hypothetical protein